MARIRIFEEKSPVEIDGKWYCRCGLTKNYPFCDGSHAMIDEEDGKLYVYGDDGKKEVRIEEE